MVWAWNAYFLTWKTYFVTWFWRGSNAVHGGFTPHQEREVHFDRMIQHVNLRNMDLIRICILIWFNCNQSNDLRYEKGQLRTHPTLVGNSCIFTSAQTTSIQANYRTLVSRAEQVTFYRCQTTKGSTSGKLQLSNCLQVGKTVTRTTQMSCAKNSLTWKGHRYNSALTSWVYILYGYTYVRI